MKRFWWIISVVTLLFAGLACRATQRTQTTPPTASPQTSTATRPEPLATLAIPAPAATPAAPQPGAGVDAEPVAAPTTAADAGAPDTPLRYRLLYNRLEAALAQESARLDTDLAGQELLPLPLVSTNLLPANSNRGEALLRPETLAVTELYLDQLQAIGVDGVKISVQYPLLTPEFPRYAEYMAFYRAIAQAVHQRGLHLTVQASVAFRGTAFSDVNFDIAHLTLGKYLLADRALIETILREMQPETLVVLSEPDTLAHLLNLPEMNNPETGVTFVNGLLDGLARGQTQIAAGTGTWSGPEYVRALAERTPVDLISIHVYPVSQQQMDNFRQMVATAQANGKGVTVSEAWLYKVDRPGGGENVAAAEDIFRRDVYSFWAPLDQEFMRMMLRLGAQTGVEEISFYWSGHFFAYLEYSTASDAQPYRALMRRLHQQEYSALQNGRLSVTGEYLRDLLDRD